MPSISDLVPLGVAGGSVAVAAITFIFGPTIRAWIEARARRETHDQDGWTKAVTALEARAVDFELEVGGLRKEVAGLRTEVDGLRTQLSERDQRIADLETTIAGQSRSIGRANARVAQLEQSWPKGFTLPAPDPAYQ